MCVCEQRAVYVQASIVGNSLAYCDSQLLGSVYTNRADLGG